MTKDPRIYLLHIRDALDAIAGFTEEGRSAFLADEMMQDAVLYKLAVIGEAVKRLPSALRAAHPTVPWKKIAGLRDIVIHEYDSASIKRIWTIVARDVPILRRHIETMLKDNPTSGNHKAA